MKIHSGFKNRIKKTACFFLGVKPVNITGILEKADTVSFDIFDSLVRRDVPSPDSVHKLVEQEFFSRTGRELPNYYLKRTRAEATARTHAADCEITLQNIFSEIKSMNKEDKALLMELEQEIEYGVCYADSDMKDIFEQAVRTGKRVVLTSDMYLPEVTIRKILDKCGYCGYEKLYLSSSYGVTKASGQLYRHLLEDDKSSSKTIVHIGDNIKSDYFQAGQAGLKPVLLRERPNTLRFHVAQRHESFNTACFRTFLTNHKPCGKDKQDALAVSIGYEVLGPLLGGYCRWLKTQTERYNIKKIFFLSREGSLLKRAYEELYPHQNETTAYLYVSRSALQVPMLLFCRDFRDMCNRIKPLMREHTLKAIGESCHLGNEYKEKLSSLNLKPEDDIFQLPEAVQEKYFHLVQELGTDYYTEQYALVKEYLSQEGFYGAVMLSDIGWYGTMQQALRDYCQVNTRLYGCYIGCWNPSSAKSYERLSRNGYLTTPGGDKEMELLLRFSCDIMETLLSNSEGSVMAYKAVKDRVVPIPRESELNSSNRKFIRQIQEYAIDFLRDMNHSPIYSQAEIPREFVAAGLRNLLQNPSLHTVHCFKNYQFLDGALRSVLPEHSIEWYMFHPRILISDFDKSSCKLFFLKDVFKLPLPWFQLLKFLRENLKIKSSNQKIWSE